MMKRVFPILLIAAALSACRGGSGTENNAPAEPSYGETYIEQYQPRDSVLIADQLRYGFRLQGVIDGNPLALLPEKPELPGIRFIGDWEIDTLATRSEGGLPCHDLDAHLRLTSFDAGSYELPELGAILGYYDGGTDTLRFPGRTVEFVNCPVDTTKFTPENIHIPPTDIVRFPWTAREWWTLIAIIAGSLLAAAGLVFLLWRLIRLNREKWVAVPQDPAHIRALRKIDAYRSDSYWAAEKQKGFYSGITDALKEYIGERYGFDAPEMTSHEVLHTLKRESTLPKDLRDGLGHLFEVADYVKFARHTAPDEENAAVVPFATRFVTQTYQQQLEEEQKKSV